MVTKKDDGRACKSCAMMRSAMVLLQSLFINSTERERVKMMAVVNKAVGEIAKYVDDRKGEDEAEGAVH